MKPRLLALFLTLSALVAGLLAPPARAQEEVNFDFFYDSLRPYGDWVQVADYGLCWHPSQVSQDWAPYTDGYWAYTDGGWTWVSYEDFGSIVYHYGRWTNLENEGWCWVPDYDWGPAWVSWRNNEDYVGWAPLPPECHFQRDTGISTWVDTSYDIGPGSYRFCHIHDFGAPVIREVCLPPRDNFEIIRATANITNIAISTGGFPFCGGPRYDFVSVRVGRPIPALRLVRETNISNTTIINNNTTIINNYRGGVQQGNTIRFPAPAVRREPTAAVISRLGIKPARQIPASAVNRGWKNTSAEDRQAIKAKMSEEVKGATPQTKKAAPITAAETKILPKTADPNAKSPVATSTRKPMPGGRPPAGNLPGSNVPGATQPGGNGPVGNVPGGKVPGTANTPGQPGLPGANAGGKPGKRPVNGLPSTLPGTANPNAIPNANPTANPNANPAGGFKGRVPGEPGATVPGGKAPVKLPKEVPVNKPPVRTNPEPGAPNPVTSQPPVRMPNEPGGTDPAGAGDRPPTRVPGKGGKPSGVNPGANPNPNADINRAQREAAVREQAAAAKEHAAAQQHAAQEGAPKKAQAQPQSQHPPQAVQRPPQVDRPAQQVQKQAQPQVQRPQPQVQRPQPQQVQRPPAQPQPQARPQAQPQRPQNAAKPTATPDKKR